MKGILWDTAGRAQEEFLSQLPKPSSVNKHFKADEVWWEAILPHAHPPMPACTVSLLHMNLQVANFQSCKLALASGVHCRMWASSTSGCAFVLYVL